MRSRISPVLTGALPPPTLGLRPPLGVSTVLQDYGFQYVSDIFGFVAGLFQNLQQFLQLDQCEGVVVTVEEAADRVAAHLVGFVFQPVDFDAVFEELDRVC